MSPTYVSFELGKWTFSYFAYFNEEYTKNLEAIDLQNIEIIQEFTEYKGDSNRYLIKYKTLLKNTIHSFYISSSYDKDNIIRQYIVKNIVKMWKVKETLKIPTSMWFKDKKNTKTTFRNVMKKDATYLPFTYQFGRYTETKKDIIQEIFYVAELKDFYEVIRSYKNLKTGEFSRYAYTYKKNVNEEYAKYRGSEFTFEYYISHPLIKQEFQGK